MLYCVLSQDHDVKVLLRRELNAFRAILRLLHSEYPVIQYHALVALSLAAENGIHSVICRTQAVLVLLCFLPFLLTPHRN